MLSQAPPPVLGIFPNNHAFAEKRPVENKGAPTGLVYLTLQHISLQED